MFETPDSNKMDLICLDSQAFEMLFNKLVEKIKEAKQVQADPWINSEKAMELLGVSSKTTLKKFCDEGHIRVSHLTNKLVLYERASILAFIERKANQA